MKQFPEYRSHVFKNGMFITNLGRSNRRSKSNDPRIDQGNLS
jgi:hypothetical protein